MPSAAATPDMLGQFHEISITTADIRESVEFYESLGFRHARTGDTWPHPYGVLTDGRVVLGLHQYRVPSPSLTCVRPGIAAAIPEFEALGIALAFAKTGEHCFNEIGFLDPGGAMVTVLEARTWFSGPEQAEATRPLCGWFEAFSLPAADFAASAAFWERFGYAALEERDAPWLHQPLTGRGLELALHRPRTLDRPMLVYSVDDVAATLARLGERGIGVSRELPRGLDPASHALLESPEGTPLLLSAVGLD